MARISCQDPDFHAELIAQDGQLPTVLLQSIIEAKILWERKLLWCYEDVYFVPTARGKQSRAGWVFEGMLKSLED